MAKKVILFIVEGINDQTCLGGVLEEILDSNEVRFQMTCGDITSRNEIDEYNIKKEIGNVVKQFKDKYHLKPEHFMEVVHLVDMDGAFLSKEFVFEENTEKVLYRDDGIYTNKVANLIERNKKKSAVIERMLEISKVLKTIPYSVYYFSANMDHVFHNDANLSDADKNILADEFDLKYAEDVEAFKKLITESDFSVKGTYEETWSFIKLDNNSVCRYSNFGTYLEKYIC